MHPCAQLLDSLWCVVCVSQVEADIQPFRGLLLGLFFMTTGASVDLSVVAENLPTVRAQRYIKENSSFDNSQRSIHCAYASLNVHAFILTTQLPRTH